MAKFELSVTVRCVQQTAFEFLTAPSNLLQIIPPDMGLELVEYPDRLQLGSRVQYQVSAYGTVQHLLHEIVDYVDPHRFTEQQVTGPLKQFVHEHLVEPDGSEGCVIVDRIAFEPPGGLAGFVMTEARILESMQPAFEHRQKELKRLLEGEAS